MGKTILFNLESTQPSISGKRHGGGIYGEILFKRMVELNADMAAFYTSEKWMNPDILRVIRENNIPLYDLKGRTLQDLVAEIKPRLFYSAMMDVYDFGPEVATLGTLHGLRLIELPHDPLMLRYPGNPLSHRVKHYVEPFLPSLVFRFNRSRYYSYIPKQDFVVVSNHTANAVREFFPEKADADIKVFYSPSTTAEIPLDEAKVADYPYFLMVSGNRWEKNILRAIIAFEKLFDQGKLDGFMVHITGLSSLDEIRYKYRHPQRFKALGYVDDSELQRQYRDAYAFLYPTLNEGFGYPPLEAMRFGVPVAASHICSIPEVCGESVLYFNPMKIDEIAGAIEMLTRPEIRERLKAEGYERYEYITARQKSDLDALALYIIEKAKE